MVRPYNSHMRIMNNLEYSYILNELVYLVGLRFDKIYKVKNGYRLKIGDAQILIVPGIRLHKTKYIEDPLSADNFVTKVRSDLANSRLRSINQINHDRIIEFRFDLGSLFFEMFAKGNCIFVVEGITHSAMREESWSDREIRRKKEYQPPRPSVIEKLTEAISEKYIISSMMKLPLGKEYSIEILKQCSIEEKTPGNVLDAEQIKCIEDGIQALVDGAKPFLFMTDDKSVDFGLFPFSQYVEQNQSETLSEAIDDFYWENKEITAPKMDKLERRLEEQEKRLIDLEKQEIEYKEMGDLINSNYENLDKLIELSKTNTLDELELKLKTKINKKDKSVDIDL